MLDWGIERGYMSRNPDRRSLGCTVNVALYNKANERAALEGITTAKYLRNLVIRDVRATAPLSKELGIEDIALLSATMTVARRLMSAVPRETLIQLALENVDNAAGRS